MGKSGVSGVSCTYRATRSVKSLLDPGLQREDGLGERRDVGRRRLALQREGAVVDREDRERSGDAAAGAQLRAVQRDQEVPAWPVGTEHGGAERGEAVGGAHDGAQVVRPGDERRVRLRDLLVQGGGVDAGEPGVDVVEHVRGARDRRRGVDERGEVDTAVRDRHAVALDRAERLRERGQDDRREVVHGRGRGGERPDVLAVHGEVRGEGPQRAVGARACGRGEGLDPVQGGLRGVHVAGAQRLLGRGDLVERAGQRVARGEGVASEQRDARHEEHGQQDQAPAQPGRPVPTSSTARVARRRVGRLRRRHAPQRRCWAVAGSVPSRVRFG